MMGPGLELLFTLAGSPFSSASENAGVQDGPPQPLTF